MAMTLRYGIIEAALPPYTGGLEAEIPRLLRGSYDAVIIKRKKAPAVAGAWGARERSVCVCSPAKVAECCHQSG